MIPSGEKLITMVRQPGVLKQTGLPRSSMWKKIADGDFPQPVRLGPRTVAWVQSEIDSWLAERIAERDSKQVAA